MGELVVRPIEAQEYDTWDAFVASSAQGTLFHTSVWKKVIDSIYAPASLLLLGCFEGPALIGGCVALDRRRMGQRTAVTPLQTPYVGYLLDPVLGEKLSDQVSRQSETLSALAGWMSRSFQFQHLINAPHLEDARPLIQAGYQLSPRFTYVLNLKLPAEELWERFDGSVRRQIRKAERANFELSANFDLSQGYSLFEGTFTRRGGKCPVSWEFFQEIAGGETLAPWREIFCAHEEGRLAGFVVLLKFESTLYYALASTDAEYLSKGVSSLLIWEIVRTFSNQEWSTLDFVGANIPSIARFKEGFNPKLLMHFQAEHYSSASLRIAKMLLNMIRG